MPLLAYFLCFHLIYNVGRIKISPSLPLPSPHIQPIINSFRIYLQKKDQAQNLSPSVAVLISHLDTVIPSPCLLHLSPSPTLVQHCREASFQSINLSRLRLLPKLPKVLLSHLEYKPSSLPLIPTNISRESISTILCTTAAVVYALLSFPPPSPSPFLSVVLFLCV